MHSKQQAETDSCQVTRREDDQSPGDSRRESSKIEQFKTTERGGKDRCAASGLVGLGKAVDSSSDKQRGVRVGLEEVAPSLWGGLPAHSEIPGVLREAAEGAEEGDENQH